MSPDDLFLHQVIPTLQTGAVRSERPLMSRAYARNFVCSEKPEEPVVILAHPVPARVHWHF